MKKNVPAIACGLALGAFFIFVAESRRADLEHAVRQTAPSMEASVAATAVPSVPAVAMAPAVPVSSVLASVAVTPAVPEQGDPVLVSVASPAPVVEIALDGNPLPTFAANGGTAALFAVDLARKPGNVEIVARFADGSDMRKTVAIAPRAKTAETFSIPAKLGGNTPAAQNKLVGSLDAENKTLEKLPSATTTLWSEPFVFPLERPIVTDAYGYDRLTGAYAIPHKGVDFRASVGTPVRAMNAGRVALVRDFGTYGKTVVVDHGLGVQTLYLHLSQALVREGDAVDRGQTVALSGDTGYAEFPHLHLSVKIRGVSVDPIRLLALLSE